VAAVIDAHHHLWDLTRRPQTWLDGSAMAPIRRSFGLADLVTAASAAGVTGTILVQVLADPAETRDFLTLADGSDLVAGVVGWADLTSPAVGEELAALRSGPGGGRLAGIRHLVESEPDPWWLRRDDVLRGLRAVADADLAYDLLIRPHQMEAALAAVRAVPGLTFVLDHCAKPDIRSGQLEPWAGLLGQFAAEPNVYCKLSGLVTEADRAQWTVDDLRPYAERVLEAFGPGRVLFGSDWPVCLLAASYARVTDATRQLTAALSPAERTAVLSGTALRAYRLDREPPSLAVVTVLTA
jgi:L-fuconolactonase